MLAARGQYASTVAIVWGNTRGQSPASILFPEFPVTPVLRRPRGRAKFTNMPAGGGRCAARIVGRGCVGQRRVCGGGGRFNACAAQQLASEGVSWPAGRSCTTPLPQRSGALGDSVCKILVLVVTSGVAARLRRRQGRPGTARVAPLVCSRASSVVVFAAASQHPVNIQSTSSQHPVNIQPTSDAAQNTSPGSTL